MLRVTDWKGRDVKAIGETPVHVSRKDLSILRCIHSQTRNQSIYSWLGGRACNRVWTTEPVVVVMTSDELRVGVKGQSRLVMARSLRNRCTPGDIV